MAEQIQVEMTYNHRIYLRRHDLESQILKLRQKLLALQKECMHENATYRLYNDPPTYMHVYKRSWREYKCPDCGKQWSEFEC